MKTQIHHAPRSESPAGKQTAAEVSDRRPAVADHARLQELADSGPQAGHLRALQAKADSAGERQKRARPAQHAGGVAQLEGGTGDVLPVGPELFLLLLLALRLLFGSGRRSSPSVSRALTNEPSVRDKAERVQQEQPGASTESQAQALAPLISEEARSVNVENTEPAPEEAEPPGSKGASAKEAASPSAEDLQVESQPPPPTLEIPGVTPDSEIPELDVRPDAAEAFAPPAKKQSGRGRGSAKPPKGGKREKTSAAESSSSEPKFSKEFIDTYNELAGYVDTMPEEELQIVGLEGRAKVAAYKEHLKIIADQERDLERKEERKKVLADPALRLRKQREGEDRALRQMDAELAIVYANKKASGDHYFTWIIGSHQYHVTVRGGDTPHVTREGNPEVHYYFHLGGADGWTGALPTDTERGANDEYHSLDEAPEKVRRFMTNYIRVKDGLFK